MPFSLRSRRPREQEKLFGLTDEQIAHAISIATVDNISLTCVHVEPVSTVAIEIRVRDLLVGQPRTAFLLRGAEIAS